MRIAGYQFASTNRIRDNLDRIHDMVCSASSQNVELVCFHECALCGYPPIETSMDTLGEREIAHALAEVAAMAASSHINILVGTVLIEDGQKYNSALVYSPAGRLFARYDKKALWGWDRDHFVSGNKSGLFEINGIRIGMRICYDIRIPELFRELYKEKVNLCVVPFSDTSDQPDLERYDIIKGHLRTRAVENVMTILSTNSISRCQTAPTAAFDPDGHLLAETKTDQTDMVVVDYEIPPVSFGMQGRMENNKLFVV
jgi:predicted amidohydrolase